MIDSELDQEQLVGHIPQEVLEELWPTFVPQNLEVWMNPVYVRRHVGSGQRDYMERVAAFNQNVNGLAAGFESPSVYAKYEGVPRADAGLTVYLEVELTVEAALPMSLWGCTCSQRGVATENAITSPR